VSRCPDFIVIGAMKCATTSLCSALARHPEIFFSDAKEPEFFCKDEIYGRGWSWYESLFAEAGDATAVGEGTTSYTKRHLFPATATRLAHHLPGCRLIYAVRHPLERIESHWLHSIRAGDRVPGSFPKAVLTVENYVQTSRYWYQLEPYLELFPPERILILFFEDWRRDAVGCMARCLRFLGIDDVDAAGDDFSAEHRSLGSSVERWPIRWLRRSARRAALLRRIPRGLRLPAQRLLARRLRSRPRWDEEALSWATEELREDSERFLLYCGKPRDYWQFPA
jgi:hypothetical protein